MIPVKTSANRGVKLDFRFAVSITRRKLSLNGLSYDRRDNVVVIDTEVIEHLVVAPRQIYVSGDEDAFDSLEITVAEGGKHIINFSEPLALPAPGSAA